LQHDGSYQTPQQIAKCISISTMVFIITLQLFPCKICFRFFRRSVQSEDWVDDPDYDLHLTSLFWHSNSSWISGGDASQYEYDTFHHFVPYSSFDVLDTIFHLLDGELGRSLYPKLTGVTYVGFSAGGQMINRYSWVGGPVFII
jgi:hypothetical protein